MQHTHTSVVLYVRASDLARGRTEDPTTHPFCLALRRAIARQIGARREDVRVRTWRHGADAHLRARKGYVPQPAWIDITYAPRLQQAWDDIRAGTLTQSWVSGRIWVDITWWSGVDPVRPSPTLRVNVTARDLAVTTDPIDAFKRALKRAYAADVRVPVRDVQLTSGFGELYLRPKLRAGYWPDAESCAVSEFRLPSMVWLENPEPRQFCVPTTR